MKPQAVSWFFILRVVVSTRYKTVTEHWTFYVFLQQMKQRQILKSVTSLLVFYCDVWSLKQHGSQIFGTSWCSVSYNASSEWKRLKTSYKMFLQGETYHSDNCSPIVFKCHYQFTFIMSSSMIICIYIYMYIFVVFLTQIPTANPQGCYEEVQSPIRDGFSIVAVFLWSWSWSRQSWMACPAQFLFRGLCTVGLILLYYVFSIGITFYNKWLMKVGERDKEAVSNMMHVLFIRWYLFIL